MWVAVYGVSEEGLYMYEGQAKRRGTGETMHQGGHGNEPEDWRLCHYRP